MSQVEKIIVDLDERSYPIFIGTDLLKVADKYLKDYVWDRQVILICDTNTGPLYQGDLARIIRPVCSQLKNLRVPAGEARGRSRVYAVRCARGACASCDAVHIFRE